MSITSYELQEFMEVFSGSQYNYGEHSYGSVEESGKRKGSSWTVSNTPITVDNYRKHLEGEKGLGIVPIGENDKCRFGVIDIDIYDMDFSLYIDAIDRFNLPLVPFKSKSGGLHIYIFFREETIASKTIEILRKFSFLLALDTLVRNRKNANPEIFPKQLKLGKGEVGSWINLPYFNAEKTLSPALKEGKELSLPEALIHISTKKTTITEAEEAIASLNYHDAPPCLQLLSILNPTGAGSGRNNYLFSFGVYLKKKDEDFFEEKVLEINRGLLEPLDENEVQKTIISSLKKKDYVYRCKEDPCASFCNKKECKKREFGIGKDLGYFSSIESGQLYQYRSSSPYYEWEVRLQGQDTFKRLRFKSEEEIIRQDTFLKLCMRELYELPSKLKQTEWFNKVNTALKEIIVVNIEKEEDTSTFMMLRNLIVEFLTGRALAETKEQILAKRVYYEKSMNVYMFRIKDLTEFLFIQKRFTGYTPNELHGLLREMGVVLKKIRTENRKEVRVACMSLETIESTSIEEVFTPSFEEFKEEGF